MPGRRLVAAIGLGVVVACGACHVAPTPRGSVAAARSPELRIRYFFSAEAVYKKIDVQGRQLSVTSFQDPDGRCAQAVAQVPCWRERDLTTRQAFLADSECRALRGEIEQSGFWHLEDVSVHPQAEQRSYPHRLEIQVGTRKKTLVYMSHPGAPTMPTAMANVVALLDSAVQRRWH